MDPRNSIMYDVDVKRHIKPLQLYKSILSLNVMYRLYYGACSEALFKLIPSSPIQNKTKL